MSATDTIDVAALVAEVGEHARAREIPAMFAARIATALQSQADALAEARRNIDIAFRAAIDSGEALENAQEELATMREALEPFASFARDNTDDDGWAGTQCQRERIVDWFGPSDFIAARRALGGSNAE